MKWKLSTALLCGLIFAGPTFAHHSFAMFDRTKKLEINGTIKDFQWTSPHIWVQLVALDKDGKLIEYGFEAGPPQNGHGWSRHALKPGDKVKVLYNPLKSGGNGGEFISATFADGTSVPDRSASAQNQ